MTGRITTFEHKVYDLPALLTWNVSYTGVVPCDHFSITCIYQAEMEPILHKAVTITLLDGENVLLRGIVDEYEIRQTTEGISALVSGRGFAARLLDNESQATIYQNATLQEIVRNHVTPYGITCSKFADISSAGEEYTVAAGSSQWKALSEFCEAFGNFTPRFDRYGRLYAAPEHAGNSFNVSDKTKIISLLKREDHYGVLSEVLMVDKTRGKTYSVKNGTFIARGGQCRRVMYTPGQSTWSAMRYTGEYQIQKSKEDEVTVELTLEGGFLAFPDDTVTIDVNRLGLHGIYRVSEAETHADNNGQFMTLTLKEKK